MPSLRYVRIPTLAFRADAQVPCLQHNLEVEVNKEQAESFNEAARPLIQWLCENVNPHHSAIVTPIGAELLEGQLATGPILDYAKD